MNKTITTSDFYLASYLIANDISLTRHERSDNRSIFEFIGSNVDNLIDDFYHDDGVVSPLLYAKAIRSLKNIMYNNTTLNIKSIYNNEIRTNRKDYK